MMLIKKITTLVLLLLPFINCFSQSDSIKKDSIQKMEITDKNGYIEMRMGDSIIRFSYEDLYFDNLQNGVQRANNEDYNSAIGYFNAALLYKRDEKQVYYNRGLAYYYLGELESALSDFDQAILIDSAYAAAYGQRGVIYSRIDKNERAKLDFLTAIEYEPDNGLYYYNLGVAFLKDGDYDEACKDFRTADELKYERAAELIKEYCH